MDELVIIAFDGDCLMCNGTVRWLAERDRHKRLRFTRLQDPAGQAMTEDFGAEAPDSILVRRGNEVLARSAGTLAVLRTLGGIWNVAAWLGRLVPRPLRDAAYDFIARHRYEWFGKADACALPSEALRRRLLP